MEAQQLVTRVHEVCPMPATAQRVVNLASNPDVRISRVAEAVAADPALAAEVLRIANSPAYGRSRAVASVEEAVMVLGLSELHSMAMAMAMLAAFRSDDELSVDLHAAAVVSGSIARSVARPARIDRKNAFLCGLLAEIGALACLSVDAEAYASLYREHVDHPGAREAAELARYGMTSREVGARLLSENGLPIEVVAAVAADDRASVGLAGLTVFSRRATSMLLSRARAEDGTDLDLELSAVADSCGIALPAGQLLDTCIAAAQTARDTIVRNR